MCLTIESNSGFRRIFERLRAIGPDMELGNRGILSFTVYLVEAVVKDAETSPRARGNVYKAAQKHVHIYLLLDRTDSTRCPDYF